MAVPFTMPEDQNEVDVIIRQLQSLLSRLQVAVRCAPENQQSVHPPSHPRSRSSVSAANERLRNGEDPSSNAAPHTSSSTTTTTNHNSSLPDLFNDLAWLTATAGNEAAAIPVGGRSLRRRTTSESSCCDETKISITAIVNTGIAQDWTQVGVTLRKIADDFQPVLFKNDAGSEDPSASAQSKSCSRDGLLSKLVPDSLTGSLWTAMICLVGWHLLR